MLDHQPDYLIDPRSPSRAHACVTREEFKPLLYCIIEVDHVRLLPCPCQGGVDKGSFPSEPAEKRAGSNHV